MKVVVFLGSLRKDSYNGALAKHIMANPPKDVEFEMVDIVLPYFDEDIESDKPEKVLSFLAQVESADAFLFVTPEYNHSVPGGLKNAIDWASRGDYLTGKPALVIGASPSQIGAERAQLHLRQILDTMAMKVLPGNPVNVGAAHEKVFEGVLTDESTKVFLDSVMDHFVDWCHLVMKK